MATAVNEIQFFSLLPNVLPNTVLQFSIVLLSHCRIHSGQFEIYQFIVLFFRRLLYSSSLYKPGACVIKNATRPLIVQS